MRHDDERNPGPDPTPSPDRPTPARFGMRGVWPAVLVLLAAATCWAVASWASVWLVPPYLLLMALILFVPSGGRPRDATVGGASMVSRSLDPARPAGGLADPSGPPGTLSGPAAPAPDPAAEGDANSVTATAPTRGKRGRGRPRKSKPEPTEASWVQVGPGKFVRVEAAAAAEAGPHESVGVPAEVSATPQSASAEPDEPRGSDPAEAPEDGPESSKLGPGPGIEPADDAASTFDPFEGRDDALAGVASPEPTSALLGPGDAHPGTEAEGDDIPAADGIAPQAEDAFPDAPATEWAEPSPERRMGRDRDDTFSPALERDEPSIADRFSPSHPTLIEGTDADRGAATLLASGSVRDLESPDGAATPVPAADVAHDALEARSGGWIEEDDDDGSPPEDSRPIFAPEPPALATVDVADEVPEPSPDWFDPSPEIGLAPASEDLEPLADLRGGDPPALGPVIDAPAGSLGGPWRIAPRPRTRVGVGHRAIGNATPSRRHARSRRPSARRPLDPRQPSRRGHGRARQITRTFPPRSPPRSRRPGRRG